MDNLLLNMFGSSMVYLLMFSSVMNLLIFSSVMDLLVRFSNVMLSASSDDMLPTSSVVYLLVTFFTFTAMLLAFFIMFWFSTMAAMDLMDLLLVMYHLLFELILFQCDLIFILLDIMNKFLNDGLSVIELA